MARRSRRRRYPEGRFRAEIESLTHDGRGVARLEGKAVFIDGALPGEQVAFEYCGRQRQFDEGVAVEILQPSADRVEPRCGHFGTCGGCSLQHLAPPAQIAAKQQTLLDNLQRIGGVQPGQVLAPITAEVWGYRRKARLAVKHVPKKGRVLVGFRERRNPYVTVMDHCPVLHPRYEALLLPLSELIGGLSRPDRIPQVELAMGDETAAMIFRLLEPPTDADLAALQAFGREHDQSIYIQTGGPDTIAPLPPTEVLRYQLPDFEVDIEFLPQDFTQVNTAINRQMITQAVDLLDVQADEKVLDLFCGLGNFSLPIARRGAAVTGVEGAASLVQRAGQNAVANGLSAQFHTADLEADLTAEPWFAGPYDKVLLDPPRSGAAQMSTQLARLGARKVVYVSCNPATLARDAGVLCEQGYRLTHAGVMDMFPHTAHVESMAVFEHHG